MEEHDLVALVNADGDRRGCPKHFHVLLPKDMGQCEEHLARKPRGAVVALRKRAAKLLGLDLVLEVVERGAALESRQGQHPAIKLGTTRQTREMTQGDSAVEAGLGTFDFQPGQDGRQSSLVGVAELVPFELDELHGFEAAHLEP